MALPRVAFPLVLQSPSTGSALVGASATITKHVVGGALGSGEAATIYTEETGAGKTASNTILTDNTGRWTAGSSEGYKQYWLEQGTYDILVSGTGLTAVYITREMASGHAGIWEPGDLKTSAAATVPEGWLACEAQAVLRTTYASLFAAIGITYGSGNGSTTFNVPDYRERVLIGAGSILTRGTKGGASTVALTLAQLASHNHGGATGNDSPSHTHKTNVRFAQEIAYTNSATGTFAVAPFGGETSETTTAPNTNHTHSISSQGSGEAHNNMQPYTVCNVWIKT